MAGKWLTKSDYLKFLIHPAYLWLAKNDKSKLLPFDHLAEANIAQGAAVEAFARLRFGDGLLIDPPNFFDGPDVSALALRSSEVPVVFGPSVLTSDNLYARADVLVRRGNAWDIYEVKGSTGPKHEHLHDLAFQVHAFTEAGHHIARVAILTVDPGYVRDGELDPHKLFTETEVTEQLEAIAEATTKRIASARRIMSCPSCPPDRPELGGSWYGWRDMYRALHPELGAGSLFNLTRLTLTQLTDFTSRGFTQLSQLAGDPSLGPEQRTQVAVAVAGHAIVDAAAIARELDSLAYPLYFLDYETFASALPLYNATSPYQQLPFQYSLHVQARPGAPLLHAEYLAKSGDYPVLDLLAALKADLGSEGSVIVWNKSFEMSVNTSMAELHPEFGDFLRGVNDRVYDLMEIFAHGLYADPTFLGSASIKKVLPVLVPSLTYDALAIKEGMTAQLSWMAAARGELDPDQAAELYRNLRTYCGQDTLAMVRIFEVLSSIVAHADDQA